MFQKIDERQAFELLYNLIFEQFQAGSIAYKGKDGTIQSISIINVINTCISAISGCDEKLGLAFKVEVDNLMRAFTKQHEIEEIIDIKLRLLEAWTAALLNDGNIDQNNLRKNTNIYFQFISLLNVKDNVFDEATYDETIKALQEERERIRTKQAEQPEENQTNQQKKKGKK